MAIKISGKKVTETFTEAGVRFEDGFVVICNDEEEARQMRAMTGGDIMVRAVYVTEWDVVEDVEGT